MKNMKDKQKIRFIASRYRNKPIKVAFYTKDGDKVLFNAMGCEIVIDPNDLRGDALVRWLRDNGFKSLASALKKIMKK